MMKWLTKDSILAYLTCPYAFELVTKGLIKSEDLYIQSDFQRKLMEQGRLFDQKIKELFEFEKTDDIKRMLAEDLVVQDFPIENEEYGIRGVIDMLITDKGRFIPIEIKFHKEETDSDKIEIAFYWLLLNKIRKKGRAHPVGFYILNSLNTQKKLSETVKKKLPLTDFLVPSSVDESDIITLNKLIKAIRNGSYRNLIPHARYDNCRQCLLFDKMCFEKFYRKKCISLLASYGSPRYNKLSEAGFKNFSAFDKLNPNDIYEMILEKDITGMGIKTVNRLHAHALSFLKNKPIIFGDEPLPKSKQIIFLDTEFDPDRLWFISVIVLDKGKATKYGFYLHDCSFNYEEFRNTIKKYPEALVITWNGKTSDFPALKRWPGYEYNTDGFKTLVDSLENRHLDLFRFVNNNVAFPMISKGLKNMEKYLGYKRKNQDMVGTDALMLNESIEDMMSEIGQLELRLKLKKVQAKPNEVKEINEKISNMKKKIKIDKRKLFDYCIDDV